MNHRRSAGECRALGRGPACNRAEHFDARHDSDRRFGPEAPTCGEVNGGTDGGASVQHGRGLERTGHARRLGEHVWAAGLDDGWSGRADLAGALSPIPQGATTILLAHEPDLADLPRSMPVALQLSGHSHGGQVRVPFTKRPVLPYLAWKYYVGLQRVGDTLVYTNRGLGTMQPPFIFTCRPEVAVLTLTTV